jgi:8-oxo-dGTP pyrophosphatase MutT (NUDIX family)
VSLRRSAGRVILINREDRVLLLNGCDPANPQTTWWFTPGGGAEEGEDPRTAAIRELHEETGLLLTEVSGPIWLRSASFSFNGLLYEQEEEFFFARVSEHIVDNALWTPLEREVVLGSRWWSVDEMATSTEPIYPRALADLLKNLLNDQGMAWPLRIDE